MVGRDRRLVCVRLPTSLADPKRKLGHFKSQNGRPGLKTGQYRPDKRDYLCSQKGPLASEWVERGHYPRRAVRTYCEPGTNSVHCLLRSIPAREDLVAASHCRGIESRP